MKYRNTKTGAVIETASTISGGNWVAIIEDGGENPAVTLAPDATEPTVKSGKPKSTKRKTARGN
jgi:hypothetical protein